MPELPEVETVRRALEPLVGCTLTPRIRRRDVVRGTLKTGTLLELRRRGKQLALLTDTHACRIQLGMSGQVLIGPPEDRRRRGTPPLDHVHVEWTLEDGRTLRFRDPRRFGGISSHPTIEELETRCWDALGPDALDVTARALRERLRGRRPLKAALLDQHVLAGVGNIYADEALFRARLAPTRPTGDLDEDETRRLAASIRAILRQAIRFGGSTLRDHRVPDGSSGDFQSRHQAYGRQGLPCFRCGRSLKAIQVAQRTTTFCPRCQGR